MKFTNNEIENNVNEASITTVNNGEIWPRSASDTEQWYEKSVASVEMVVANEILAESKSAASTSVVMSNLYVGRN